MSGEEPPKRRWKERPPKTGGGERQLATRVKNKKAKESSRKWIERQLNDPYVARARADGYRARAAYKLIELDEQFHVLKRGARVIDLGAAPGGWAQVCVNRGCKVVGVDLLPIDPLEGAVFFQMDLTDPATPPVLIEALGGPPDIVLSDMAANTTGHRKTDQLRIVGLVESAAAFAGEVLNPGGVFLAKVFQSGADADLVAQLKRDFATVKHVKPAASRQDSSERYVLAIGFRGAREA